MSFIDPSIAKALAKADIDQHVSSVLEQVKTAPLTTATLLNPKARARFLEKFARAHEGVLIHTADHSVGADINVLSVTHGTLSEPGSSKRWPAIFYHTWRGHKRRPRQISNVVVPVMTMHTHAVERGITRTGDHGTDCLKRTLETASCIYGHVINATEEWPQTFIPASNNGKDWNLFCAVRKWRGVPNIVTVINVDRLCNTKWKLWTGWSSWLERNNPTVNTADNPELVELVAEGAGLIFD